jgi:hypothetical protein
MQEPCSLGLSATSHQYFSLTLNQPPATNQQAAVLFSHNKPAPAISHQPTERADRERAEHGGQAAVYIWTRVHRGQGIHHIHAWLVTIE